MKARLGAWHWSVLCSFIIVASACVTRADLWQTASPAPGQRVAHSTVFTGTEVIVWGGGRANTWINDGARYDPSTDTWRPISANHGLTGRWHHGAVWTGKEMIVWGGTGDAFEAFQQKVQSHLGSSPDAQSLIDAAQAIIDRLHR